LAIRVPDSPSTINPKPLSFFNPNTPPGSIVNFLSTDPSAPINPPLQATVTEVDAHGRVLSLEFTALRVFDSASAPILLVVDSSPPFRRTLSGKLKDPQAVSLLMGREKLSFSEALGESVTAAAASSSSPSAVAAPTFNQPPPGTLQIKLDAFTPYAALFKVILISRN
jgi:hypothetical protein